ncbi:hypothetical protein BDQ17DRAFT_1374312 [Cyathus striatus]|nr:hypothetical protein BDQ17DRAFT_1374312 [Cyathus striatus]
MILDKEPLPDGSTPSNAPPSYDTITSSLGASGSQYIDLISKTPGNITNSNFPRSTSQFPLLSTITKPKTPWFKFSPFHDISYSNRSETYSWHGFDNHLTLPEHENINEEEFTASTYRETRLGISLTWFYSLVSYFCVHPPLSSSSPSADVWNTHSPSSTIFERDIEPLSPPSSLPHLCRAGVRPALWNERFHKFCKRAQSRDVFTSSSLKQRVYAIVSATSTRSPTLSVSTPFATTLATLSTPRPPQECL